MNAPYPGIDYAGPGSTINRDENTDIRYGVISCNSVGSSLYDAQEMDYGKPEEAICESCNCACTPPDHWGGSAYCPNCDEEFEVEFPDMMEPCGWSIDDGEYQIVDCLDNDAMILKSPYYTYAQFCSPCVPGAGNLDNPYMGKEVPQGDYPAFGETFAFFAEAAGFPKVFCLGWDWFDEFNPCPYPAIYRVSDGEPVPKPSVN